MKFATQFSNRINTVSCAGNRQEPIFERLHCDETNEEFCGITGYEDNSEKIQLAAEGCLLTDRIAEYMNGDADAFSQKNGFSFDATQLPKDYISLINKLSDDNKRLFDEVNKLKNARKQPSPVQTSDQTSGGEENETK